MSERRRELPIPPQSAADPEAFEMLRVWASKGNQDVTLMGVSNDNPAMWGLFLADLVRHLARAYHLNFGNDLTQTSQTIRSAFEAEMDTATDWGEGRLM